ncbi:MAG: zinc-ribbon domain-containing protein [Dehalococcoidia bacterium]
MYCSKCGAENDETSGFCRQCGASLGPSGAPAKTGTSLEPNIAGLLCYVLGWLTGLIFILIEKEDQYVRFHAMQSIAVFAPLHVLMIVLNIVFWPLGLIVSLLSLVLWILLMVKAYQGQRYKIPWAGDFAERHI